MGCGTILPPSAPPLERNTYTLPAPVLTAFGGALLNEAARTSSRTYVRQRRWNSSKHAFCSKCFASTVDPGSSFAEPRGLARAQHLVVEDLDEWTPACVHQISSTQQTAWTPVAKRKEEGFSQACIASAGLR